MNRTFLLVLVLSVFSEPLFAQTFTANPPPQEAEVSKDFSILSLKGITALHVSVSVDVPQSQQGHLPVDTTALRRIVEQRLRDSGLVVTDVSRGHVDVENGQVAEFYHAGLQWRIELIDTGAGGPAGAVHGEVLQTARLARRASDEIPMPMITWSKTIEGTVSPDSTVRQVQLARVLERLTDKFITDCRRAQVTPAPRLP